MQAELFDEVNRAAAEYARAGWDQKSAAIRRYTEALQRLSRYLIRARQELPKRTARPRTFAAGSPSFS